MDVGGIAFLMTRENYQNNRAFPGILPVLSLGMDKLALNVTFVPDMPQVRARLQPLVFFQLAYFVNMD